MLCNGYSNTIELSETLENKYRIFTAQLMRAIRSQIALSKL